MSWNPYPTAILALTRRWVWRWVRGVRNRGNSPESLRSVLLEGWGAWVMEQC